MGSVLINWRPNPSIVRSLAAVFALSMTVTAGGHNGPAIASAEDGIIVIVPGCVVDSTDVIGWWAGTNNLIASIGPDLTGGVGFGPALFGTGFAFDDTSGVSTAALPIVSTGLTVEMWIKPFAAGFTGRSQSLAARWDFPGTDDSARSFSLLLDPSANLVWTTDETSTRRPEELRAAAPQLYDGYFHHVAATWDGVQMSLFLDGYIVASRQSQGGVLNGAATTPFRLGSQGGLGDSFRFNGIIDEPSVIRRALTAAEVEALVGAGPNGKCVTMDPPAPGAP